MHFPYPALTQTLVKQSPEILEQIVQPSAIDLGWQKMEENMPD